MVIIKGIDISAIVSFSRVQIKQHNCNKYILGGLRSVCSYIFTLNYKTLPSCLVDLFLVHVVEE